MNFTFKKLLAVSILIYAGSVFAQEAIDTDKISFPIAELGNCADKDACKVYCDDPANLPACLDFAERNQLMSRAELSQAKKFLSAGAKGPGGCTGKDSCQQYCDDISHIDECVTFAENNDLLPPEELEEARKVKLAINKGVKPPACKNKTACDTYCSSPDNMEECISFAEAAGFIQGQDLEEAKKVLSAIKKGVKPPPCKGKNACEQYCTQEEHLNECMNFAEAAGLVSPEELEMIKKTGGKGPGGCRGKEACENYCKNKDNIQSCTDFAIEHGFIKPEEAEMIKKTGGKGPGGCMGRKECENFCNDPANQETCFSFAKENNLIPQEEIEMMNKGREQLKGAVSNMPPEVRECLKTTVGEEVLSKLDNGTFLPNRDLGEKMRSCFENFRPEGQGERGMPPPPDGIHPDDNNYRPGEYKRPPEGSNPEGYQDHPENYPPPDYQKPPEYNYPENYRPPENYQPGTDYPMPENNQSPPNYPPPPEGSYYQAPPPEQYPYPGDYQSPTNYQPSPDSTNYQAPPEDYHPPENYQAPTTDYQPPPIDSGYTEPPPPGPESFLHQLMGNKLLGFIVQFLFPR